MPAVTSGTGTSRCSDGSWDRVLHQEGNEWVFNGDVMSVFRDLESQETPRRPRPTFGEIRASFVNCSGSSFSLEITDAELVHDQNANFIPESPPMSPSYPGNDDASQTLETEQSNESEHFESKQIQETSEAEVDLKVIQQQINAFEENRQFDKSPLVFGDMTVETELDSSECTTVTVIQAFSDDTDSGQESGVGSLKDITDDVIQVDVEESVVNPIIPWMIELERRSFLRSIANCSTFDGFAGKKEAAKEPSVTREEDLPEEEEAFDEPIPELPAVFTDYTRAIIFDYARVRMAMTKEESLLAFSIVMISIFATHTLEGIDDRVQSDIEDIESKYKLNDDEESDHDEPELQPESQWEKEDIYERNQLRKQSKHLNKLVKMLKVSVTPYYLHQTNKTNLVILTASLRTLQEEVVRRLP